MQFSLLGLFGGMTAIALGIGAITMANPWVASLLYTFYFLWMALSLIGCVVRSGTNRVFWIGAFIGGAMYYHVAFHSLIPWDKDGNTNPYGYNYNGGYSPYVYSYGSIDPATDSIDPSAFASQPDLLSTKFLNWLATHGQNGLVKGQHVRAKWGGSYYYPGTILNMNENGGVYIAWDDQSPPGSPVAPQDVVPDGTVNNRNWIHKTGHSVFGILLSWFGAWFAWAVFVARDRRLAENARS
jgi:hypothetical protein